MCVQSLRVEDGRQQESFSLRQFRRPRRKAFGKAQEQIVSDFIVPVEVAGKHHHRNAFFHIQTDVTIVSRNHTVLVKEGHPAVVEVVDQPAERHVFVGRLELDLMRPGQERFQRMVEQSQVRPAKISKSLTVEYSPPVARMISPMSHDGMGVLR